MFLRVPVAVVRRRAWFVVIAEGGKERLTLLLSYRKTKQASALLYSTRYSTLAVSLLDYERDNSFGGKMKYFGITLQSSMNEKKTINTRNSRSRTGGI